MEEEPRPASITTDHLLETIALFASQGTFSGTQRENVPQIHLDASARAVNETQRTGKNRNQRIRF